MSNNENYQCLILAGGLATRLRPITENIPKAMVPVDGKPFIEYQIELLEKVGIKDIILCIGYKGHMIKEHFKDGSSLGVNIRYSEEESLLGTGGAIRNAINLLNDKFFILYGDAYLNIDYKKIIDYVESLNCHALLSVYKNEGNFDTSNVSFIDNKHVLYDKESPQEDMKYIDYGMSVLTKKVIEEYIPEGEVYDLANCYNQLSKERLLVGYEVKERFYEIGSFSGLQEFKDYINNNL
tara:strand:- start:792 stop:1505 length:714 start_codon:yes stop_codon:yes gene_type:complete